MSANRKTLGRIIVVSDGDMIEIDNKWNPERLTRGDRVIVAEQLRLIAEHPSEQSA